MVKYRNEWTIRQVTELSNKIKRKPYTEKGIENDEIEGPPAKIQIPIPKNVLLRNEKPEVAWWSEVSVLFFPFYKFNF
jgi:hypothetical protein